MSPVSAETVITALWSRVRPQASNIYAVLDGARNEGIHSAVATSGLEYECLYRGELAPDMAEVAPYLVKLAPEHALTTWIIEQGWGSSWGIFVDTAAGMRPLRQHLRQFVMVYSPEAKPLYFRYYDPRVFRVYLPTCNAEELAKWFGPVNSYLLEDEQADVLLHFSKASEELQLQKIALSGPAALRLRDTL
jgi:hypothetical protein